MAERENEATATAGFGYADQPTVVVTKSADRAVVDMILRVKALDEAAQWAMRVGPMFGDASFGARDALREERDRLVELLREALRK